MGDYDDAIALIQRWQRNQDRLDARLRVSLDKPSPEWAAGYRKAIAGVLHVLANPREAYFAEGGDVETLRLRAAEHRDGKR